MKRYWKHVLSLILAGTGIVALAQIPASFVRSGMIFGNGAQAQGAGGWVLVEQHTASGSAALDFTTCFSSTYDTYDVELVQLLTASNGANLLFRVSTDGGSTYDSGANYDWIRATYDLGSFAQAGQNGGTSILLAPALDTTSNWTAAGHFRFYNPLGGAAFPNLVGQSQNLVGGDFIGSQLAALYTQTTAVNAFRLFASTGNLASGTARCYGLAK